MAKRKSSKTTAQSDPTRPEDASNDSITAEVPETPEHASSDDTVFAGDDTIAQAASNETVDDAIDAELAQASEPLSGNDTITASDSVKGQDAFDDTVSADWTEASDFPPENDTIEAGDDTFAETLEPVDDDTTKSPLDDPDAVKDGEMIVEPEPESRAAGPVKDVQPQSKSSGFFPMLLGGVLAAVLGFIAARADLLDGILPASMRTDAPVTAPAFDDSALSNGLEAVTARLAKLEATVAALPPPQEVAPADPAPVVDLSGIEAEIAALSDKITALENQPPVEAPVPTEALDAALAQLRATATEQQAEIDRLLTDQRSTLQDAQTAANATLARTAMTSVQAALDAGTPFDTALGELTQTGLVDVPQALSDVADKGVASLAALQQSIPDAARAALAAARDAETNSGLGGFIQRQLGARAVEPRAGSDPDAILSRIEAATRAGNLKDALTEAAALPAPSQSAMSTWIEQAQSRQNAVSAANALADRLSAL